MFKSIASLTIIAAAATAFALPAHAIYVGNGVGLNGLQYNAIDPNGLGYNGTRTDDSPIRVLTIELPTR